MALIDYDLHKLGWRAFQDLCAVILQQVLGQTFHTFADSNDAGRDGAFHGHWAIQAPSDPLALGAGVATVAQCKFSAQNSGTLTPSMLVDEVTKVGRLHSRGLCDAYLLLTNLSVTGRTDEWLREQVRTHGVQRCLVLDGRWICQQISQRPGALWAVTTARTNIVGRHIPDICRRVSFVIALVAHRHGSAHCG